MRKMYLTDAESVRIPAVASGLEMALHLMYPESGAWGYKTVGVKKVNAPRSGQVDPASHHDRVGRTVTDLHRQAQANGA